LLDFNDWSSVDDATKGIVKSAMMALKHNNHSNQYLCNNKGKKTVYSPHFPTRLIRNCTLNMYEGYKTFQANSNFHRTG
jgi:hypothetical protein